MAGCQSSQINPLELAAKGTSDVVQSSDVKLAQQHFKESDYGLSEKLFRKVVAENPNDINALMGLAASYDQLGRFDLAERAYMSLFKIVGRSPKLVSNYGFSHYLRGNKEQALELFKEAGKTLPKNNKINANIKLVG
jgi:Flp pilus assembly protein TadD